MVSTKINKTIGLFHKLQNLFPRTTLPTIYKAFVRPHLDYGDIFYDQPFNLSFHQKPESIQYRACVAVSGTIQGNYREKVDQELDLESLQSQWWYRKLAMLYNIFKSKSSFKIFLK